MILLLCYGFSKKLLSKVVNFKTSRLNQSPLQAQKQIYFLNQANEDKHLIFVLLFLFHSCFCLCPVFIAYEFSSVCTDTAYLSHLYFLQNLVKFALGREPLLLFLIHLSQLAIFEKLLPLSSVSPFHTVLTFLLFPPLFNS